MPRRRKPLPNANDYLAGGNVFKSEGNPLPGFTGVTRVSVTCKRVENRPLSEFDELQTNWSPEHPEGYREHLVPCVNSSCMGGGFRIHDIVGDMISKGETKRVKAAIVCSGMEKGLGRRCYHTAGPVHFEIEYG